MTEREGTRRTWLSLWRGLSLPLKVGVLFGLLGALLSGIGLARGAFEPFSWRGLAMAIVLAGGSWGLVSWALASAMIEAGRDEEQQETSGGDQCPR